MRLSKIIRCPKVSLRKSRIADAYTLTEMLVVLVIVGLLAAIVGPRLFGRLDDAKHRTAKLQLASLEAAIDLFRIDMGRLPVQEEGLEVLVNAPGEGADMWLGPYLARGGVPKDPWGNPYVYEVTESGFRILSYGADGRAAGEGADKDIVAPETDNVTSASAAAN